ncbi:phenylalanine--tRNA ligase subunit beta [Kineosporia succinea]|uniref:Phenylalanine--tRNA ligase beta subunit n=1 Tax=Kineosporia succinea TaxID=84632 RepID=A0ABT9P8J4_9ACTN|nr:phenylalanine--tRNA ligase subunit beta [Kineosporia succinea]MDP9828335.1 phenylalanyl-tRNA synthetase beta chain [Kineosporia succinea]
MRAPLTWLAEYVELPQGTTALEVAADLVKVGLEEEGVHGGDVTGPLVVGRVLDFTPEPQKNGKTIRWCSIDVGEAEPRGIVCGAGNFLKDDLVVVCLPGAVLPGGFTIAARKTYGHTSDGMICSALELGLGDDHNGIIRLTELGFDDVKPGDDAIKLLGLDEETVEVNVTPDRGYCFSVRGVAREYSHSTGAVFKDPAAIEVPKATDTGFKVELDDQAPVNGVLGGDRFVARVVKNVDATASSPRWMQRRLEQAGMRPISLAVDVTNYVMLAVGHPLHAFDLDQLAEPIVVRRAAEGEKLTTLDDVERTLHPEDLLVTDSPQGRASRVLSLAGVMGGASSEVSATTTNVLVEAAHWDPITVARTMRRHKLSTEAGKRYERGVDTQLADVAAELAVRLLVEYGGEAVEVGPVTDVGTPAESATIEMAADFPSRIVGLDYTRDEVVENLTQIGCEVSGDDLLTVKAPSWRSDLKVAVDLVEEVARLRGYEHIPSQLPVAPPGRGLTHSQRLRRSVARALAEHGAVEVLTYPFMGAAVHDAFGLDRRDPRRTALKLANPLSDEQPFLRTSLLATLVDAVKRNVSRGFTDLALFEIGSVTLPTGDEPKAGHPSVAGRPSDEELAQLKAAIPDQPLRAAIVFTGQRDLPGWNAPGRAADWSDAVEAAVLVAGTVNVSTTVTKDENHAPWHPGRCARLEIDGKLFGHAGELHPKVVAALGLPPRTVAAEVDLEVLIEASARASVTALPISTFPLAKEDVALVVKDEVASSDVEAALVAGAGELLESVRLFDLYAQAPIEPGHKSLAFALRFRAPDRTLTAEETAAARDAAVAAAGERTGAVQRG